MVNSSSIPTYIFANPGQIIKLVIQTVDGYGNRSDGYTPTVDSVILPDLSLASGYPVAMTKLQTGLYTHAFQLPSGSGALGSYIASVQSDEWQTFVINVARPFGNSSVSPI